MLDMLLVGMGIIAAVSWLALFIYGVQHISPGWYKKEIAWEEVLAYLLTVLGALVVMVGFVFIEFGGVR